MYLGKRDWKPRTKKVEVLNIPLAHPFIKLRSIITSGPHFLVSKKGTDPHFFPHPSYCLFSKDSSLLTSMF